MTQPATLPPTLPVVARVRAALSLGGAAPYRVSEGAALAVQLRGVFAHARRLSYGQRAVFLSHLLRLLDQTFGDELTVRTPPGPRGFR